jgi:hypothetical protein
MLAFRFDVASRGRRIHRPAPISGLPLGRGLPVPETPVQGYKKLPTKSRAGCHLRE